MEARIAYLVSIGHAPGKAKEVASNDDAYEALMALLDAVQLRDKCDAPQGKLLARLSAQYPKAGSRGSQLALAALVASREVDTAERLDAGMTEAAARGLDVTLTREDLVKVCGVGLVYSEADLRAAAETEWAAKPIQNTSEQNAFLGRVKQRLPFSDGAMVKQCVDALLAGKQLAEAAPKKKKTADPAAVAAVAAAPSKKALKKQAVMGGTLPEIDYTSSATVMAERLVELVTSTPNKEHAVAMVADSLAALQRHSYAQGTRASGLDSRNGVQLPPAKYTPQ